MPRPRVPRPAIAKRLVDDAKPRDGRYLIFDGLVHGFALKVEPSGAKTWVVQKSQAGRSIRVTLGAYPDLTVDQARRAAQAAVVKLVRGGNPTAEKRIAIEARRLAERDALTVNALWDRYRMEEVIPHNRASTAAMKQRMWERSIGPKIGSVPVRQVTGQDLSEIVRGAMRLDAKGNVTGGRGCGGQPLPAAAPSVRQGAGVASAPA